MIESGSFQRGALSHVRFVNMNQNDDSPSDEYDFSRGVRGKYAGRVNAGAVRVVIDAELAKEFPTDRAVNDALRELLRRRASQARSTRD